MKKLFAALVAVAALAVTTFVTGLVTAEVAVAAPLVSCSTAHPVKWDRPGGYCEQVRDLKSMASQVDKHKHDPKPALQT
ncbi:MAG: hypothetical protein J0I99_00670 [Devosia sp.]|uniref:hypothetical protein n=1 Tax=Devosia sp. TaxID=1871048 RepID=UPI001AC12421|nr:hypothetical protein [Devosia sp.]MBN9314230.1 hypothetical protein [Devosia sp.]